MKPAAPQDGTCPECGTAELTSGRAVCQACTAVKLIRARDSPG